MQAGTLHGIISVLASHRHKFNSLCFYKKEYLRGVGLRKKRSFLPNVSLRRDSAPALLWSDLAEFSGEPLDRGQDYGSTERGQGHTLEQRAPGGVRLGTHL